MNHLRPRKEDSRETFAVPDHHTSSPYPELGRNASGTGASADASYTCFSLSRRGGPAGGGAGLDGPVPASAAGARRWRSSQLTMVAPAPPRGVSRGVDPSRGPPDGPATLSAAGRAAPPPSSDARLRPAPPALGDSTWFPLPSPPFDGLPSSPFDAPFPPSTLPAPSAASSRRGAGRGPSSDAAARSASPSSAACVLPWMTPCFLSSWPYRSAAEVLRRAARSRSMTRALSSSCRVT